MVETPSCCLPVAELVSSKIEEVETAESTQKSGYLSRGGNSVGLSLPDPNPKKIQCNTSRTIGPRPYQQKVDLNLLKSERHLFPIRKKL